MFSRMLPLLFGKDVGSSILIPLFLLIYVPFCLDWVVKCGEKKLWIMIRCIIRFFLVSPLMQNVVGLCRGGKIIFLS